MPAPFFGWRLFWPRKTSIPVLIAVINPLTWRSGEITVLWTISLVSDLVHGAIQQFIGADNLQPGAVERIGERGVDAAELIAHQRT